jgi:hypothetical protein
LIVNARSDVVKSCPKCRLINPSTAKRCDCGYDFSSRRVEASFLTTNDRPSGEPRKPSSLYKVVAVLALLFEMAKTFLLSATTRGVHPSVVLSAALIPAYLASAVGLWQARKWGSYVLFTSLAVSVLGVVFPESLGMFYLLFALLVALFGPRHI